MMRVDLPVALVPGTRLHSVVTRQTPSTLRNPVPQC